MDHETLFTASKWHILKQLERQPRSPLELAKICKTSIANVSQQLRLLEMAGLVTAERIPNRDKDMPRILYRLAGNLSYVISTSGQFVDKKVLQLSEYNKIVMRIWFFERQELHYALEKAFWRIEEHLPRLQFLAVDKENLSPITFYVKCNGKLDLKPFTITEPDGTTRQVIFDTTTPPAGRYYLLHERQSATVLRDGASHDQLRNQNNSGDGK
jgi:DNA-binding transcriptional ArsR family regulator